MKFLSILAALVLCGIVNAESGKSIYDIPLKDINGKSTSLKAYKGKAVLIVNVASKCGYTPQYTALEALHQKYKGKGFEVLGFPCNQFGHQEPGTSEEIKQFCSTKYNVTFPLFEKIEVNGANRNPLYTTLVGADSPFPGDIKWNFTKILVGPDGKIVKRFESGVKPESAEVAESIESVLPKK
ncbi:MAG TPA: glutathione peroxidase [Verrucomicrobiae bacterium]|nr:glutathione peroxidase [Verrucomicrobiae bacterium]